ITRADVVKSHRHRRGPFLGRPRERPPGLAGPHRVVLGLQGVDDGALGPLGELAAKELGGANRAVRELAVMDLHRLGERAVRNLAGVAAPDAERPEAPHDAELFSHSSPCSRTVQVSFFRSTGTPRASRARWSRMKSY